MNRASHHHHHRGWSEADFDAEYGGIASGSTARPHHSSPAAGGGGGSSGRGRGRGGKGRNKGGGGGSVREKGKKASSAAPKTKAKGSSAVAVGDDEDEEEEEESRPKLSRQRYRALMAARNAGVAEVQYPADNNHDDNGSSGSSRTGGRGGGRAAARRRNGPAGSSSSGGGRVDPFEDDIAAVIAASEASAATASAGPKAESRSSRAPRARHTTAAATATLVPRDNSNENTDVDHKYNTSTVSSIRRPPAVIRWPSNIGDLPVPVSSPSTTTTASSSLGGVDDVTVYRARLTSSDQKRSDPSSPPSPSPSSSSPVSSTSSNTDNVTRMAAAYVPAVTALTSVAAAAANDVTAFRYVRRERKQNLDSPAAAAAPPSVSPSRSPTRAPVESKRRQIAAAQSPPTRGHGRRGRNQRAGAHHSSVADGSAEEIDWDNPALTQEAKDEAFARQLLRDDERVRAAQIAADERMAAQLQREGSRPNSAAIPPSTARHSHWPPATARARGAAGDMSDEEFAVASAAAVMAAENGMDETNLMLQLIAAARARGLVVAAPFVHGGGGSGNVTARGPRSGAAAGDMSFESLSQLEDVAVGIPSHILHSFPTRVLSNGDDIKALGSANRNCSICISDFEPSEEIMTVPCLHHFHTQCVTTWLEKHKTCPLCITRLDTLS